MDIRLQEVKVFLYRILLVYFSYTICRLLFYYFNQDLIQVTGFMQLLELCYFGLRFDNTAIAYTNMPFILLSILPIIKITSEGYQRFLIWIYFTFNTLGMLINFIDFAYYRFNLNRMMMNVMETIQSESNKSVLLFHFLATYFHLLILFVVILVAWIWAYKKVKVIPFGILSYTKYTLSSLIFFFGTVTLTIMGARGGDFKKSTRPISLIDAMDNIDNPQHADLVLNSTFTLIRTINKNKFKKSNRYSEQEVNQILSPIKQYPQAEKLEPKPNVIIFILESMGREYWGTLNEGYDIPDFVSYTPFLDSLSKQSLIFPNAFATSRKSIHGMPSILAGIPSFEVSYASSPYAKQKVQSIVSVANDLDYDTSFFHGASNGSMGFLGFSNTLGFNHYYGRTEFNDEKEFDGFWGIWDEPFLQYMKSVLDTKSTPFLSTVFTITSHEPYIIPKKYDGQFDKGFIPMHQCVGYTDYALKQFFEKSKKEPWFENTIFVFTADHGNQSHFPFYEETVNRFANPIMFYKPNDTLKGIDNTLASHMDIFPTIADLIGYEEPFRSWGRSLISDEQQSPFVINYFSGGSYFMMDEKYICVHDGGKAIGFYDSKDKNMQNNLIAERNDSMNQLEKKCGVFLQNYFNSIVDNKMHPIKSEE